MAKRNQRIYTILGTALGTGLAVYGIRQGLRWYQRRQQFDRFDTNYPESAYPGEGSYDTARFGREPIPTTGLTEGPPVLLEAEPDVLSPAMGDMTGAERVNSDRVSDYDDRGTAFNTTEMGSVQPADLADEDIPATGSMTGANVFGVRSTELTDEDFTDTDLGVTGTGTETGTEKWTDRTASDRLEQRAAGSVDPRGMREIDEPLARGEPGPAGLSGQQSSAEQYMAGQHKKIVMDDVVAPLIEHAIAFHSVMNLLRSRQRDGVGHEGTESLTEGDRHSMRAVLDQMQQRETEYNEANLRSNPLALRSYIMTHRLRDALDNLTYSGADLFRIHDELRGELCSLARELDNSGQVTITGMDHIRQLYEC